MAKQIWINTHAMLEEELKNPSKVIGDYYKCENERWEKEYARELLEERNNIARVNKNDELIDD